MTTNKLISNESKTKIAIMAGGIGSRLWPLSNPSYPKQFLKLFNGHSLFQETLLSHSTFCTPLVILQEEHEFIATKQISEIGLQVDIVLEPAPKSTAPCSIIAALIAKEQGYKRVLLLPSDLYISSKSRYLDVINNMLNSDYEGVATIGVKPTSPHTGYGYIEIDKNDLNTAEPKALPYQVKQFIEKPNLGNAQFYFAAGNYLWNAGIFSYDAEYFLRQVERLQASMLDMVISSYNLAKRTGNIVKLNPKFYENITADSIDYAVIEQLQDIMVFEGDFGWTDIGNWDSLWRISQKDRDGNCYNGNVVTSDVSNSYIKTGNKLTVVIGLENLIIVDTGDALLVADQSKAEELRNVILQLKQS